MKPFLATLVVLSIVGCGELPPPQAPPVEFPVVDPDVPATIAEWEASPYNFANAKIAVVELQYLHGRLGDTTPQDATSVAVQVYDAKTNGITAEQQAAIDRLQAHESAIHAAIREALYEYYQESYPAYHEGLSLGAALYGGGDEIDDILPKIVSGEELDDLVEFGTIYIHPPVNGAAAIGIDFIVPWDEEHGIGLRLENDQVAVIGTSHEAFPPPTR